MPMLARLGCMSRTGLTLSRSDARCRIVDSANHGETTVLKVKTSVKAGRLSANHGQTLAHPAAR